MRREETKEGPIGDLFRDICHQCLSNNSLDPNGSRTMAKFLDELSTNLPDHLINFIERLFDLFDSDCLQIRNSLLNLSVEILRSVSSSVEYKSLRSDLFFLHHRSIFSRFERSRAIARARPVRKTRLEQTDSDEILLSFDQSDDRTNERHVVHRAETRAATSSSTFGEKSVCRSRKIQSRRKTSAKNFLFCSFCRSI